MNLIPWGLKQSTGAMVHVDAVPNGKASGCICPACKLVLVAKNKGAVKAHHFAHYDTGQGACEGWFHATAKQLLYEQIQRAITEGVSIPVVWSCQDCRCEHGGDLVKGSTSVHIEERIIDLDTNIRPDILLKGQRTKIVEIVVTHEPELPVWAYAAANELPVVRFRFTEAGDLAQIFRPALDEPLVYGAWCCRCPLCPWCGETRTCADHRYCEQCGTCVEDARGQLGGLGDHGHCRECNQVLVGKDNLYGHHYRCYTRKIYGLPPCPKGDHSHCRKCGKPTPKKDYGTLGYYDFWVTCRSCSFGR